MPKAVKAPEFDNIDDVRSKFVNTVAYHDGKAMLIKQAQYQENENGGFIPGKFAVVGNHYQAKSKIVKVEDPLFNYKDYNIGYANQAHYAVWWFRKPLKQYQQGLKKDQMSFNLADPNIYIEDGFSFNRSFIAMLENDYPNMDTIEKALKEEKTKVAAFHRDFALSWDEIHEDFVLEYRGKKVGASINGNLKEFKLMAEYKHVAEALMEALG